MCTYMLCPNGRQIMNTRSSEQLCFLIGFEKINVCTGTGKKTINKTILKTKFLNTNI